MCCFAAISAAYNLGALWDSKQDANQQLTVLVGVCTHACMHLPAECLGPVTASLALQRCGSAASDESSLSIA